MKYSIYLLFLFLFSCGNGLSSIEKTSQNSSAQPVQNRACTEEYVPVCGQPPMPPCPEGQLCVQVMPPVKTFENRCKMEQEKAQFMYSGECRGAPL